MSQAPPKTALPLGPFKTQHKYFNGVLNQDPSDSTVDVYYPVSNANRRFPLIS